MVSRDSKAAPGQNANEIQDLLPIGTRRNTQVLGDFTKFFREPLKASQMNETKVGVGGAGAATVVDRAL